MTKKVEPPKSNKGTILLVGGVAIAGAYGLAQCLSDDAPKFKPWTGAQKAAGNSDCVGSALSRTTSTCMANTYCQCAVENYQSRGMPYDEFQQKLSAITAFVDGRGGYFCYDVARNQCGRE